jgi:hypothetical protein
MAVPCSRYPDVMDDDVRRTKMLPGCSQQMTAIGHPYPLAHCHRQRLRLERQEDWPTVSKHGWMPARSLTKWPRRIWMRACPGAARRARQTPGENHWHSAPDVGKLVGSRSGPRHWRPLWHTERLDCVAGAIGSDSHQISGRCGMKRETCVAAIGAGLGGATAAAWLQREGSPVQVYEQAKPPRRILARPAGQLP